MKSQRFPFLKGDRRSPLQNPWRLGGELFSLVAAGGRFVQEGASRTEFMKPYTGFFCHLRREIPNYIE